MKASAAALDRADARFERAFRSICDPDVVGARPLSADEERCVEACASLYQRRHTGPVQIQGSALMYRRAINRARRRRRRPISSSEPARKAKASLLANISEDAERSAGYSVACAAHGRDPDVDQVIALERLHAEVAAMPPWMAILVADELAKSARAELKRRRCELRARLANCRDKRDRTTLWMLYRADERWLGREQARYTALARHSERAPRLATGGREHRNREHRSTRRAARRAAGQRAGSDPGDPEPADIADEGAR